MTKHGVSYRLTMRQWRDSALASGSIFEFVAENLTLPEYAEEVTRGAYEIPSVAHFLGASVASVADIDRGYLEFMQECCDRYQPLFVSDHLAFSSTPDAEAPHFLPPAFSRRGIDRIAKRIDFITKRLKRPLLLENIAYYFPLPGGELTEIEFWVQLLSMDCGLRMLLDLDNLYINAANHKYSAQNFIDAVPVGSVAGVHLSGHTRRHNFLVDTHSEPIPDEVWNLSEEVLTRHSPEFVVIERDRNLSEASVLSDVHRLGRLARLHNLTLIQRREHGSEGPGDARSACRTWGNAGCDR
jgi:uncharacterized protein (UPF0276 family)